MKASESSRARDHATARLIGRCRGRDGARAKGLYRVVCRRPDGSVRWVAEGQNLVVNEGLDHILDCVIAAGTQITAWYVGLCNADPSPAAGDTMDSHIGWTENTNYDENYRQTYIPGSVSGQSVDNSASEAAFTMNVDGDTVGGMFLTSNNGKGGTTGTLYSVVAFTGGNKAVDSGDTLKVTYTFQQADDGA